jgi:hypothetical protein
MHLVVGCNARLQELACDAHLRHFSTSPGSAEVPGCENDFGQVGILLNQGLAIDAHEVDDSGL